MTKKRTNGQKKKCGRENNDKKLRAYKMTAERREERYNSSERERDKREEWRKLYIRRAMNVIYVII